MFILANEGFSLTVLTRLTSDHVFFFTENRKTYRVTQALRDVPFPEDSGTRGGYVGFTQRGLPTWKPVIGIGLRRLYVTCPSRPGRHMANILGYVGFT